MIVVEEAPPAIAFLNEPPPSDLLQAFGSSARVQNAEPVAHCGLVSGEEYLVVDMRAIAKREGVAQIVSLFLVERSESRIVGLRSVTQGCLNAVLDAIIAWQGDDPKTVRLSNTGTS